MKKKFAIFCLLSLIFTFNAAHGASEIRDTEIEAVLTELVRPLADAAGIADGRLKIHIIGDDNFNAFVSGGEDVYLYTGLLTRIKSPLALQAVVAHELGHMVGGHMAQMSARMEAEMTRALIMQALGVGLMVANPQAGAGLLAGSTGLARQSMLSFGRDEERIADSMGIDLMVKANLDPSGFLEVMEQMNELTGAAEAKANPNNTNHPLTTERIKNVKEKLATVPKGKRQRPDTKDFLIIKAKLIGYLDSPKQIAAMYPDKDKSDAAIYARSIANMRGGNLAMAKTGAQTLISRVDKNPYYYELLGDIEYQFGHYDDSVMAYEESLRFADNAPQIQTALALVLSERNKPGDVDRAVELCKRSILTEPQPLAYFVLGKSETLRGNPGHSSWAMAEYYNMMKDKKKSREYAKQARRQLPKKSPEYIKSGELL